MGASGVYSTLFAAVFIVSAVAAVSTTGDALKPGTYKIENVHDNLVLTIQGANATYAIVVADHWLNFREQKWEITKLAGYTGYHFTPKKYNSNNQLSFYRDARRKYPVPEIWGLTEVPTNPGKYLVKSNRTNLCLMTNGRRKTVGEAKCDRHLKTQHWSFVPLSL